MPFTRAHLYTLCEPECVVHESGHLTRLYFYPPTVALRYFVSQIQGQCLHLDGIFAWEAMPLDDAAVWSVVRSLVAHGC